jgi:hypothetical protein
VTYQEDVITSNYPITATTTSSYVTATAATTSTERLGVKRSAKRKSSKS